MAGSLLNGTVHAARSMSIGMLSQIYGVSSRKLFFFLNVLAKLPINKLEASIIRLIIYGLIGLIDNCYRF
jgi:hypothetical protein